MKSVASLLFLAAFSAQASPTLVCVLQKVSNRKEFVSVTVDFAKKLEEYYISDSLKFADNSYAFNMTVAKSKNTVELSLVFDDSNDEVASHGWTLDLSKAKAGKPVVKEPLILRGQPLMDFICYYNQSAKKCGDPLKKKKK